jgi:serine/threonine protein kinase
LIHQNTLKLADFGIKKRIEKVSDSQSFETIPYIDPKSFKKNDDDQELDEKSDIYSVGVLFWEISSGCLPFAEEPYDISLINKILEGHRETPVPDTPEDYKKIYTGKYLTQSCIV